MSVDVKVDYKRSTMDKSQDKDKSDLDIMKETSIFSSSDASSKDSPMKGRIH